MNPQPGYETRGTALPSHQGTHAGTLTYAVVISYDTQCRQIDLGDTPHDFMPTSAARSSIYEAVLSYNYLSLRCSCSHEEGSELGVTTETMFFMFICGSMVFCTFSITLPGMHPTKKQT